MRDKCASNKRVLMTVSFVLFPSIKCGILLFMSYNKLHFTRQDYQYCVVSLRNSFAVCNSSYELFTTKKLCPGTFGKKVIQLHRLNVGISVDEAESQKQLQMISIRRRTLSTNVICKSPSILYIWSRRNYQQVGTIE